MRPLGGPILSGEIRKLPTKRAAARSGVLDYYDFEIDTLAEAAPSTVRISLRQNMGAPAQPVVPGGGRVGRAS